MPTRSLQYWLPYVVMSWATRLLSWIIHISSGLSRASGPPCSAGRSAGNSAPFRACSAPPPPAERAAQARNGRSAPVPRPAARVPRFRQSLLSRDPRNKPELIAAPRSGTTAFLDLLQICFCSSSIVVAKDFLSKSCCQGAEIFARRADSKADQFSLREICGLTGIEGGRATAPVRRPRRGV